MPRPRVELRWFWASPLLIAACFAAIAASVVLARAMKALQDARGIRAGLELTAARLVAEQAAAEFVSSAGLDLHKTVDAGGGIEVRTSTAGQSGQANAREVRLATAVGDRALEFAFPLLPGATSPVFGLSIATAPDAPSLPESWPTPAVVARADWPRFAIPDDAEIEPVHPLLGRDAGIALTRLSAGTDREDFVVVGGLAPVVVRTPLHGVVCVPGNLWIDAATEPLRLQLATDLTLVVSGNVYLGRSVVVTGGGRLTIATRCDGGVAFADVDGNGRWSPGDVLRGTGRFHGPVEGAGNVYFGLPREGRGDFEFDLGFVVAGELNLAADRAAVRGPLLLGHGGTVLPGRRGELVVSGRSDPQRERSVLPGFGVVGCPRPGPLRLRGSQQQPLYLAAPSR